MGGDVKTMQNNSSDANRLPETLRPFFWDTDFSQLDVEHHRWFIAERLMEKTTAESFRWLLAHYSAEDMYKVAQESRRLGVGDRSFWRLYLAAH
jgi:hypothetical protein